MKKLDVLTLLGVGIAIAAVMLGQAWEGGHPASLVNLPALLIVLGGSIGAMMVQAPINVFRRALFMLKWAIFPPDLYPEKAIAKFVAWGNVARREGLLGLESSIRGEKDAFVHKGLQMLVDGKDPSTIRSILEVEIDVKERFDLASAKIFESMGGYTPTIGILGAVIGLIQVMENLSEPEKLGHGIATAFVATIYGVGLANLLLLPLANKLKAHVMRNRNHQEMLLEGLISVAEGENPKNIEGRLKGYLQ